MFISKPKKRNVKIKVNLNTLLLTIKILKVTDECILISNKYTYSLNIGELLSRLSTVFNVYYTIYTNYQYLSIKYWRSQRRYYRY